MYLALHIFHVHYSTLKLLSSLFLQKLKGMDVNGLSDSYCRISIVPPLGRNVREIIAYSLPQKCNAVTFFLDTELAQDKDSGQEHKPSLQRQPPFSRSEI